MLQTRCWAAATAVIASTGWPGVATAATLNVPADYPTIQACIDAAVSGVDECVVAPGTYQETINFLGKAITLRSSLGADVTTIDATGIGGSVVTCASGEGPDTILNGFTITCGTGTENGGYTYGGGMYNDHSSPTVTNCTFSGNMGDYGGGMYNSNSNPIVTNCTFTKNTTYLGDYKYGGGMINIDSSPTVTDCTFSGNTADYGGGGMYNYSGSPTVTKCTFSANTARVSGGGMFNAQGNPTVTDSTFSANTANFGGGVLNENSNPTVIDCAFSGNTGSAGGGMYNYGGSPTVTNCAFSANTANFGGGMRNHNSNPTVTNCILWHDSPDEIVNIGPSVPAIRFSDVQGGLPVGAVDGGGNINFDPMFVRPPDPGPDGTWNGVDDDYGDLRLSPSSPCIDAGDPGFAVQPGETDLEGHARVLCGRVDMGAYEFGIGDYDCDQTIDLTDFAAWNACMTGPSDSGAFNSTIDNRHSTIGCEVFDFDGDEDVDIRDFAAWQNAFTGE